MRNVHEFDGKVPMKLEKIYTENEVRSVFNDAGFLRQMVPDAQRMVHRIITENSEENVDPKNHHIDARQLFVALLDRVSHIQDHHSWFPTLLEEQLVDMSRLGPCPQGRTIRLWQLLQSII